MNLVASPTREVGFPARPGWMEGLDDTCQHEPLVGRAPATTRSGWIRPPGPPPGGTKPK